MDLNTTILIKNVKVYSQNIELTIVRIEIIKLIEDSPNIIQDEMANLLGVTSRTIRNHILVDNEYIKNRCR